MACGVIVIVHQGAFNLGKLKAVRVYRCLRFVRLGLRTIVSLCKKAKTDEDEVLVNSYVLFPLDGAGRFGGNIKHHTVNSSNLIEYQTPHG
jgi:hypothetical protein